VTGDRKKSKPHSRYNSVFRTERGKGKGKPRRGTRKRREPEQTRESEAAKTIPTPIRPRPEEKRVFHEEGEPTEIKGGGEGKRRPRSGSIETRPGLFRTNRLREGEKKRLNKKKRWNDSAKTRSTANLSQSHDSDLVALETQRIGEGRRQSTDGRKGEKKKLG